MKMLWILDVMRRHRLSLPVLGAMLALQGCGIEQVSIPDLIGPAALGNDLTMQATPDFVVADNESISVVRATLRNQNGQPIAGRAILFRITDEKGNPAGLGELTPVGGVAIASGSVATASTNASGVAQVNFSAPARTDLISATSVLVQARPVSDDSNGQTLRSVRIEVVPAESRLFPPRDGNKLPTCSFVTQPARGPNSDGSYPTNFGILFQSTSSDADGRIVRYEWDFGDGNRDVKPDVNHAYGFAGTYSVTHIVTDNNGGAATCARGITVK